jgi:hypothetical protein
MHPSFDLSEWQLELPDEDATDAIEPNEDETLPAK